MFNLLNKNVIRKSKILLPLNNIYFRSNLLSSSIGSSSSSSLPVDSTSPESFSLDNSLIVTKSCAKRIKQLQNIGKNKELFLRIAVEGGGCSGFQYVFQMENERIDPEEDLIFTRDGSSVVVDTGSFELIKGSTIDYTQELIRSAFAITNNPQSASACGCGSSFAAKNFASNPALD